MHQLEERGYVTRQAHPLDARATLLTLTQRGIACTLAAEDAASEAVERWRTMLGGPRFRQLQRALRAITALRKRHESETDHGGNVVRQLRKPRSRKINISPDVRPCSYSPGSSIPVRPRLSFHRRCCTSGSYAAGCARVSVFRS